MSSFFVGDGMGTAHRNAIRLATKGIAGELEMDDMPYSGLVHTNSADSKSFITDSAAAATAIASGVKTYNGAISVDLQGKPVETILEQAKKSRQGNRACHDRPSDGRHAGCVCRPHRQSLCPKRHRQAIHRTNESGCHFGRGEDYWYPAGNPGYYPDHPAEDPEEASKGTQGNLVERAKQLGYTYVRTADELKQASGRKLLGLFANEEMFQQRPEGEGDVYNPVVSLPDMTKKRA